ncbi:MAG: transporter [Bacteroidota bacterium]
MRFLLSALCFLLVYAHAKGQYVDSIQSHLEIYSLETESQIVILSENDHFEAPNWSRDGKFLLINSKGLLYKVDLDSNKKTLVDTGDLDHINNDHGISPDGQEIVISNNDLLMTDEGKEVRSSRIYLHPITGGIPKLVTPNYPSYWHGWAPDGRTLAYVAKRKGDYDIYTIDSTGGKENRLTSSPGLDDGPDYSPDGKYIYYNSMASGKMEIWRMDADGSNQKQLTDDTQSNWFPHPSPIGDKLVYISYKEDQGSAHPPMKEVELKLMDLETFAITTLCSFTGGQGTINVPSWSPDGKAFAFVTYNWIRK